MKSAPGTQQGSNQELRERCHEQTHLSFPAREGTDIVEDPMMQVVEIGTRHKWVQKTHDRQDVGADALPKPCGCDVPC